MSHCRPFRYSFYFGLVLVIAVLVEWGGKTAGSHTSAVVRNRQFLTLPNGMVKLRSSSPKFVTARPYELSQERYLRPNQDEQAFPELRVQFGHSFNIAAVAFSPSEKFALTAGNEGGVSLWSTESGWLLKRFDTKGITAIFSPDGQFILTGGVSTTLWDARTLKPIRLYVPEEPRTESIAFSPDSKLVLVAGKTKAHLCNVETGKEIRAFDFGKDDFSRPTVDRLAFSPDGKYFLIAGDRVTLWSRETLLPVHQFGETRATGIAFSPSDGKFVLVVNSNESVPSGFEAVLYESETGHRLRGFRMSGGQSIDYAVFSPDGARVLLGSLQLVEIQSFATGEKISSIQNIQSAHGESMFSRDGRRVLSGHTIWKTETGEQVMLLESYSRAIWSGQVSPNGQFLLTEDGNAEFILWNFTAGKELKRFKMAPVFDIKPENDPSLFHTISFSPDNNLILINAQGKVTLRNPLTDDLVSLEVKQTEPVGLAVISSDKNYVVLGRKLLDRKTGDTIFEFGPDTEVRAALFSPDNNYALFTIRPTSFQAPPINNCKWDQMVVWNLVKHVEERHFECPVNIVSAKFSSDSQYLLESRIGDSDKIYLRLWDVKTWTQKVDYIGHEGTVFDAAFSPGNGKYVVSGGFDGTVRLWDTFTGKELRQFKGHEFYVKSVAFTPDGRYVITNSADNTTRVWNTETAKELCRLISLIDGTWVVATQDGRFDTSDLELVRGFHWIMPDDRLRALPLEIFMRDYYEPRLLSRVLKGDELSKLPPLAGLNRVQPKIEKITVVPQVDHPELVDVEVEVSSVAGRCLRNGNQVECESGVYDLRLYRDGQLVGQSPTPTGNIVARGSIGNNWREQLVQWRENSLVLTENNKPITLKSARQAVSFKGLRLPQRIGVAQVEFTAYAFNEDRVKSATGKPAVHPLSQPRLGGRKRAYVIRVGVDANESGWNLDFAAKGARDIQKALDSKANGYDVVDVELLSTLKFEDFRPDLTQAKRRNIQGVLDLLAGRPVSDEVREEVDPRHQLQPATPDDLVMLFIASHGYADPQGNFYVIPYDTGQSVEVTEEVLNDCFAHRNDHSAKCVAAQSFLSHSISSDDLAAWWRDVDAGEMVMILDSCHSAAVPGRTFRPGPLGDPGFGQLSYDKGMLILSATQPDKKEVGALREGIKGTLLSSALISISNAKPQETTAQWLKEAERLVPEQYRTLYPGLKDEDAQFPVLLDFTKSNHVAKAQSRIN